MFDIEDQSGVINSQEEHKLIAQNQINPPGNITETTSSQRPTSCTRNISEATWTSCCLRTDRAAVFFFSQLGISLLVMSFCLYQLSIPQTVEALESRQYYSGTVTLIVGVWLPSPRMRITSSSL